MTASFSFIFCYLLALIATAIRLRRAASEANLAKRSLERSEKQSAQSKKKLNDGLALTFTKKAFKIIINV